MENNTLLDRSQLPQNMSEAELRSALADRKNIGQARLAFKALSQRHSRLALEEAKSILKDNKAPNELRSIAAVELGRHTDAASEEVLISAVSDAPPELLKHVARSLGQTGGPEALERLEKVTAPDRSPAALALQFAKTLISYRIGSNAYLLEPGKETEALTPEKTERTNLEFGRFGKEEFEAALPSIRRQLPAMTVDAESGLRFMCGGSQHLVLLNEQAARTGSADIVRKRPMIVGAILKYRVCSEQYSLDEYLLTNGGGKERVTLIGVRPSGIMVHAGFVHIVERAVKFELLSSNPPYSRPIDLRGDFDPADGRLSFSQVLVGTSWKIAARPSVPKRLTLN